MAERVIQFVCIVPIHSSIQRQISSPTHLISQLTVSRSALQTYSQSRTNLYMFCHVATKNVKVFYWDFSVKDGDKVAHRDAMNRPEI